MFQEVTSLSHGNSNASGKGGDPTAVRQLVSIPWSYKIDYYTLQDQRIP
jgi:hypothetical protein